MSLRIREIDVIPHHRRIVATLFKHECPVKQEVKKLHGVDSMNNPHFGKWNNLVLKTLDYINPLLYKYPKLNTAVLKIFEKMIISSKI